MARSKIWKYFDKIDLQTAQCQLCEKVIKTCGNTSNLMKHMKTHPQIDVNDHDSVVVRGILKRESNHMKIRSRKVKYATMKVKPTNLANDMDADCTEPDMEGNMVELVDAETQEAVSHVNEDTTYVNWVAAIAESATETVSAEDIIEFEPKDANDQMIEQAAALYNQTLPEVELVMKNTKYNDNLAYFVCRDKHPLDIIKGEGFKRWSHVLCPTVQLPTIEQLGTRIAQKTQQQVVQLRQKFAQIKTLSLSCAINTPSLQSSLESDQQQRSYLEVTAHYHEGLQRRSRTLSVQLLPVPHNASVIVERLERICQRFDIKKSKITCIVSQSNGMLEDAVSTLLGAQHHVPCFAHALETILEMVMERPEFRALCHKLQEQPEGRAMSSYELLERHVRQLQKADEVQQPVLNSSEFQLAVELLGVLAPLASAVRQLCGNSIESYPSASQALPIAYTVLCELKQPEHADEQQIAYELRLFVIRLLKERFEGMEMNVQLALATMLDPRYRNMPFENSTLMAKYMTHLYELYGVKAEDSAEDETSEEPDSDAFTYDIWAAYRLISREKHKHIVMNGEQENEDEISSYFCTTISSLQSEPLLLWKDLLQFHPFLHSQAKKYLHIPASAVPPARIFTAAGAEVFEQQCKLSDDHMSNMLFMADCNEVEWQI